MEKMTPTEKCIKTAKDAGCPRDQVEGFLRRGYIPLPWQWRFHAAAREADKIDGPVDIGLGGARGPGKSHAVLSQVALDDCQRVKGLKVLFLRQTGVAAKESFDDLIEKVVVGHVRYERSGHVLKLKDNSRIILGGFHNENDIDKYIGIEYDIIIVEELNQLTQDKYDKLRGSLRTSKPDWRPRMYTSFNPGGKGHALVKSRYVIPYRQNKETETRFIPSTYKQNPHLNREYIDYLEGLKGDLAKAWREGEFDLFAGQAFSEFSRLRHVMRPIMPSVTFEHYMSIDWGSTSTKPHAFACYLHAVIKMKMEDGRNFQRVITYREWVGNQKTPHQWAEIIYNDTIKIGIKPIKGYCDPAMFNPQTDMSKAISKLMMEKWKELHKDAWITLVPGSKNRIGRKATVHNWLSIGPDELPYWVITENCKQLINTLPELIVDENNLEDIDTDGPDDPYDSVGYFLPFVKFISVKAGPKNYAKGAIIEKIKYDKDGRQIAFSPEDFANQYKN